MPRPARRCVVNGGAAVFAKTAKPEENTKTVDEYTTADSGVKQPGEEFEKW
jgi:hypothetical protein